MLVFWTDLSLTEHGFAANCISSFRSHVIITFCAGGHEGLLLTSFFLKYIYLHTHVCLHFSSVFFNNQKCAWRAAQPRIKWDLGQKVKDCSAAGGVGRGRRGLKVGFSAVGNQTFCLCVFSDSDFL